MTLAEYNALPAISASAIKRGRLSMAHMRHEMLRPRDGADGDTPALRFGRLAHAALFEPVRFAVMIAVWGGARKQGGLWDGFKAANEGKELVTRAELDRLQAMQEAARADLRVRSLLGQASRFEHAVAWQDDRAGACKCRADACGDGLLIEYKTAARIESRSWLRSAETLGYPLQLGWYWHGLGEPGNVWVICQESVPPYCCATYQVPAALLVQAYGEAAEIAALYRACEVCGVFPGPYPDILIYERPTWAADGGEVDLSTTTEEGGIE